MKELHIIAKAVDKAKDKDLVAMKYLYEIYAKEMLTTSYRITNNLSDSEDIIQDSFIHSFKSLAQLNESSKYGPWLKRIVINKSLSSIKKRRRYELIENTTIPVTEPEDKWYERIPFAAVQKAIQELPNGCREILTLYLLDEYKHRDIAEMLDISVSTSKSQYQYGLKLLRNKLKSYVHG